MEEDDLYNPAKYDMTVILTDDMTVHSWWLSHVR